MLGRSFSFLAASLVATAAPAPVFALETFTFESREHGFAIAFPGTPDLLERRSSPPYHPYPSFSYEVQLDDPAWEFDVTVATDTPGIPPLIPEKVAADARKALPEAITKYGRAPLGALEAHAFATRIHDRRGETRVARAGARTYLVSVHSNGPFPPAAVVEAFFASSRVPR
jgi:hypothetical protein